MKLRECLEIAFIVGFATAIIGLHHRLGADYDRWLVWAIVAGAFLKTIYYFCESLLHLVEATAKDQPYHRFLLLMAYNMAEVTLSFAVDFFCLKQVDPGSFSGIDESLQGFELLFECFYFSVLNFSFFGYGDITPAHIPSKIVMLLEVVTAFSTVIFLLSDFVSMKESMRKSKRERESQSQAMSDQP